jgi:uncharacterized protein (TIGR02266 family)
MPPARRSQFEQRKSVSMAQIEPQPRADATQRLPASSESQIRLVFDKFQGFVDEYRPKISLGGVFLESSQPQPVGTRVSCEFQLADGFRLCRAVGEVVWLRRAAAGPGRPAGMGVRFLALDDQGRELILRILEEQVKGGGEPFEVERVPPDGVTGPPPAPREDPASTHPRRSPPAGPQEDPASTFSRPALVPAESPPAAADEFKAPWGQELPALPDDVIEPPLDGDALAAAYEDFDSDLSEAGFGADTDLLDLEAGPEAALSEAPDEISFSDEALDGESPAPSFDMPSFDAPGFDAPGFEDVDMPLAAAPPEAGLGVSDVDAPLGDPAAELLSDLGSASSPWPEPAAADDQEPVSRFGLPEPPSSRPTSWSAAADHGAAWERDDGDAEWEEERDSGLRGVLHRLQITLAESSGRFILILVLLLTVVAALIFEERILAWVGLGSPPVEEVSTAPLAAPEEEPPPAGDPAAGDPASAGPSESVAPGGASDPIEVEGGAETAAATPDLPPRPAASETELPRDERPGADAPLVPATRVERITYDQAAEGTRVTVWLDGGLTASRYEHDELTYAPRKEQLVLSGIGTPYASTVEVGTLELDRIRTGLHAGNRLNLVFDLSSEHMTLAELRARENRLEILVRRR